MENYEIIADTLESLNKTQLRNSCNLRRPTRCRLRSKRRSSGERRLPTFERRTVLDSVYLEALPTVNNPVYMADWGLPPKQPSSTKDRGVASRVLSQSKAKRSAGESASNGSPQGSPRVRPLAAMPRIILARPRETVMNGDGKAVRISA